MAVIMSEFVTQSMTCAAIATENSNQLDINVCQNLTAAVAMFLMSECLKVLTYLFKLSLL